MMIEAGLPLDAVVLVHTSQDSLVAKLSARYLDPETGEFYNMLENPPADEAVKARLIQRADDQEPVIRGRLDGFFKHIVGIEVPKAPAGTSFFFWRR